MAENFPNLKKETDIQVQEAQWVPNKMNPRRPTPRHIKIKMAKIKRVFKRQQEKNKELITREPPQGYQLIFSTETLQARKEWQDTFKILKGKSLQPRILHPASLSFTVEGEIQNFSDMQKLKEYSNTKPILKEILKVLLQIENKQERIGKRKS